RQEKFAQNRVKLPNLEAIAAQEKEGRVTVLFNSVVTDITDHTVTLRVQEETRTLAYDKIFALIGAEPPKDWLKRMGIEMTTIEVAEDE
ncbi:MAG TPA: FAD-dependent oxidoreductase, partial [Methylomirabilota bacterium]|nr:FAD-dependent oxidoreductase [Methylomirabilota bacterium]